MSTEPEREFADLDAQLSRLPQWQPPQDFAVRLAAAATRQSAQPATPRSTRSWLWGRVMHHLPLALGAGVVALVLVALPWSAIAADPLFAWLIAGGAATVGLVYTVRLLRAS